MDEDNVATNPVADAGTPAPEPEVVETETDGLDTEQVVEDDSEEIEHEGQKHRIAKALKPLLMMQSDYTRKTQEVAERRKELDAREATQAEQFKAAQAHIREIAQLTNMDTQLEQYSKLDWQRLWNDDPVQAGQLQGQFLSLRQQKEALVGHLTQKEREQQSKAQQEAAKRLDEAQTVLKRDIPEWSPELANKLRDFATSKGELSPEEAAGINDPRLVKLLHLAYVGSQLIDKQRQAAKPQPAAANPVPTVASRSAPAGRDPDKMTTDEWVRWREADLRKKAAR